MPPTLLHWMMIKAHFSGQIDVPQGMTLREQHGLIAETVQTRGLVEALNAVIRTLDPDVDIPRNARKRAMMQCSVLQRM